MKPKPIIKWPGGKTRMLKHLLPIISAIPHTLYCEPYFGGGAVFFAKPPVKNEVINDINQNLYNLYRQLQRHPAEVYRQLRFLPKSRALLKYNLRLMADPDATEIQRAAAFLYNNKNSFGGTGNSYAVQKTHPLSQLNMRRLISCVSDRLDNVSIESLDALYAIKLYDSPGTLFFLDPPYTAGEIDNYQTFYESDLTNLYAVISKTKGNWIVTINDSPAARKIFNSHPMLAIKTRFAVAKNTDAKHVKSGEIIISNLPFPRLSILP